MSSFVWSSKDRLVQMSAIRWISADYAVLKNSGLWDQKPSVGGSSPSLPPASSSMPTNLISLSSSGDRTSVVSGKSVSVRVDLGGRRIIKKKNKKQKSQTKKK